MTGALGVLIALLAVAYLGPLLGRMRSAADSTSGPLMVLIGIIVGPLALDLVEVRLLQEFQPLILMGGAWLALLAGMTFGSSLREGSAAFVGLSLLGNLLVLAGILAAVWFGLQNFTTLPADERLILTSGAAVVTSSNVLAFASKPRSEMNASAVRDIALAVGPMGTALTAALLIALFAALPGRALAEYGTVVRGLSGTLLGVGLGVISALLLGREFRRDESWGLLLGVSLLCTGVCARFGLSAVGVMFVLGLTLSAISAHRRDISTLVATSERAVWLPFAMLVGASLQLERAPWSWLLLGLAHGAWLVAGVLRSVLSPLVRRHFRLSLFPLSISTYGFALAAAAELHATLSAPLGRTLLVAGVVCALVTDLTRAFVLRRTSDDSETAAAGLESHG